MGNALQFGGLVMVLFGTFLALACSPGSPAEMAHPFFFFPGVFAVGIGIILELYRLFTDDDDMDDGCAPTRR